MKNTLLTLCLIALLGASCSRPHTENNAIEGKILTTDANLLKLADCGDYMYAEVRANESDSVALAKYIIVDSGCTVADIPEGCTVINAPLGRTIVSSSVHTAGISELGKIDAIAGVTDAAYYVSDDPVAVALMNGQIADAGSSLAPDIEKIIDLNADGILVTPYEGVGYDNLKKTGVPIVMMTDYLESTPLGRAEWLLFIGALYGRYDEAKEIFDNVNAKYQRLRLYAASQPDTPVVITEKPMSGVWYVPGGKSYMSTMITDAGATYPWVSTEGAGSIPLDVSVVINDGSQADYWLVKDAKDISRKALLEEVPHAKAFKAFPEKVYVCNTLKSPYYNAIAFHPELVLNDMVEIFHTGKCGADSVLRFFQPIQ